VAIPGKRDVAMGLPDPQLLPSVADALGRVDLAARLQMTDLDRADPELIALSARGFAADGIPADHLAVTSGAFDALERLMRAYLRTGDKVLVEDPVYSAVRDLILALGLVPVSVPVDDSGPRPEAVRAALARGVQAAVIVPRAQNPLGAALDPPRAQALRAAFADHPGVLLIEDDHAGAISGAPCLSLTTAGIEHWAVMRSASKTLHPDLRVAVVAGDETTIARVEGQQALGPRWVSHILQAAVVAMLTDPEFEAITERARSTYARRRQALVDALAAHDVPAHGRSGLNVWVPVEEEAPVIRALYDAGWVALAGERFRIDAPPGIRVTTATLAQEEAPAVAEAIAHALHRGRTRRQY
jgi:DNA-binding transcriptional MocR family regulator